MHKSTLSSSSLSPFLSFLSFLLKIALVSLLCCGCCCCSLFNPIFLLSFISVIQLCSASDVSLPRAAADTHNMHLSLLSFTPSPTSFPSPSCDRQIDAE